MRCCGKRKGGFKRRGGIKWREINKCVLKKIQESIPYSRGDEEATLCVNGSNQCPTSFRNRGEKMLQ
jgi:hypothetical protein